MLALAMTFMWAGCGGGHNAELVIQRCADQDGTALSIPVQVTVDGITENWNPGEALIFPIRVDGDVKVVTVEAEAGNGYTFTSKPQYDIIPDERKELELRFFRAYAITIEALDPNNFPISGVDVYANGRRVGTTDDRGYFVWEVSRENTRPGETFEITLEKDGQTNITNPITITEGVFSYTAGAQLNVDTGAPPPPVIVDCTNPANRSDPECRNRTPVIVENEPPQREEPSVRGEEPDAAREDTPPVAERNETPPRRTPPPATRRRSNPNGETAATQRLVVTTEPPGVEVILRDIDDQENTERISETPAEVNLRPGYYQWEVPANGEFLADASSAPIDLLTQEAYNLNIKLNKASDMSPIELGDQARRNGDIREAVAFYSSVAPSDANAYKEAQTKLGETYLRDSKPPDYQQAIAAFNAILRADPSEYSAHNNLAVVYFEIGSYDEAENHLDRMLALKQLVPRTRRGGVEREVRYRKGLIHNARFQSEQNLDNKRERGLLALSVLQDFIDLVPQGDSEFGVKRQDAREKHDAIQRWIEQNR